jgi:hypothetical protein
VSKPDYKEALEQAKAELTMLHAEKEKLTKRIGDIERHMTEVVAGIKGLARLCDQQVTKELLSGNGLPLIGETGLSNAVKFALQTTNQAMSPVEVRETLRSLGFDISKYKTDFLATLHTVLKRLHVQRHVDVIEGDEGRKEYKWITETDKADELANSLKD